MFLKIENHLILGVILYGAAVAISSEILAWIFIYRTNSFRLLKENLEKHAAKVSTAKDDGASQKNVKKREAKLHGWEEEAGKTVASINFKTAIIMTLALIASVRLVPAIFGSVPVGKLPFEPPGFMQKLTHRGLEGADVRECSALFVYMMCQGSIRILIQKLLAWGPSRRMSEVKPYIPKAFKQS